MDREQTRKELQQFPKKWVVAFAARVAAQSLPGLLAEKKTEDRYFACWPEEQRQKHLFAVLRANVAAAADDDYASSSRVVRAYYAAAARAYDAAIAAARAYDAARAAVRADARAYAIAYDAAAIAYDAAIAAARAYAAAADDDAAIAYDAYSYAAVRADARADAIAYDASVAGMNTADERAVLKKSMQSGLSHADYLQQPLYAAHGQAWLERGRRFACALRTFGFGFDVWADWFQGWIEGSQPDRQFLESVVHLPEAILAQDAAQINAYLKNSCQHPLNRVRVIFLGYGEAGKTSLVRALNGLDVVAGKEQMTPGIEISAWQVPGTEITAHFWDFGGQVVAHATHQFFLRSSCLYVLLIDGRREVNANEQAEYWLEHVRVFGGNAPVMLVGNKADLCPVSLDMARIKEKHGNVRDFYPLSCTKYKTEFALEFQRFEKSLSREIKELGVHQVRFGRAHLSVLNALDSRSNGESFLQKAAWRKLCQESGLSEQGGLDQDWLTDILDKLGVIVHFPNIAELDSYILNPRWLTYGVYTLLYSQEVQRQKGRMSKAAVIQFLGREQVRDHLGNVLSYPPEKATVVIKAMEQFKLCFPCRHEPDMIVIPALLESDQPKHGFSKKDCLAFEFDFAGFLPRHVLPNFIVGRHDEIRDELVWQHGVVLCRKDGSAEALAEVDYHARKLSLWLKGRKANEYFKIVYDEIGRMLGTMNLDFIEWVIVPESSRIGEKPLPFRSQEQIVRADFGDLLALEEKGATEYTCKAGTFDLSKILQIMPMEARPEYRRKSAGKSIYIIEKHEGTIMFGEKPTQNVGIVSIPGHVGGHVIADSTIQNSFNPVAQAAVEPALKAGLERLCQQVEQMLVQLPEKKKEEVRQDLDNFVKEATKETPRRKWYELSAEGLTEAAKACKDMGAPVVATVAAIVKMLAP